jgi:DNA-binding CsgD family transcriptional regulator
MVLPTGVAAVNMLELASGLSARLASVDLIPRLTVIGIMLGAVVAAAVIWLIQARLDELTLVESAMLATAQVQLGVLSHVTSADCEAPHTPERLADIKARLGPALGGLTTYGSGVLHVNLVAPDGIVIFSSPLSKAGQPVASSDRSQLTEALGGHVSGGHEALAAGEDAPRTAFYDGAFEVFVPVILDGQVVGAYEMYHDLPAPQSLSPIAWVLLTTALGTLFHLAVRLTLAQVDSQNSASNAIRAAPVAHPLTRRELDVLGLLAAGHSYRSIATQLVLSEETIRSHVKRILRKLGQPNRTAAVVSALQAGIIRLPLHEQGEVAHKSQASNLQADADVVSSR